MRLFVAVFPPEAALAHLIEVLSSAGIKTMPPERLHVTLAFLGDQPDPEPALAALDLAFATNRRAAHSSPIASTPSPSPTPPPSPTPSRNEPPPPGPAPSPTASPAGHPAANARPGAPTPGGPQPNARAPSSGSARGQVPVPSVGELAISGGGRFGALLWAGITGDIDGLARLTRLVRRSLRANRVRPDDKRFRPHITVARRLQPEEISSGLAALRPYDGPLWTPFELVLVHSEIGPNPAYHHLRAWPLRPPS